MKKEDKFMEKCAEAIADIACKEFKFTEEQQIEIMKKANQQLISKGYKPVYDV